MCSVTDLHKASSQLFADVVTGQDVEDWVDCAVDGGQAERDGVGRVHGAFEETGTILQLGEVEDSASDQQDDVIWGEADQEKHHHCHRQPADALLLLLAQPRAALYVGQDATICDHQDQQRDHEADHEAGIVEARHHDAALTWLEAAVVTFGGVTLLHDKDRDVNNGDQQHNGEGDEEGKPLVAKTTGLQAVDDGDVAVAGDAAEQEDADVHVVEEDVACEFAGDRAPRPPVASVDVMRPQRQSAQVSEVTQRQAPQVNTQDVLPAYLQPGEVDSQQVSGQSDRQHHTVQQHQR